MKIKFVSAALVVLAAAGCNTSHQGKEGVPLEMGMQAGAPRGMPGAQIDPMAIPHTGSPVPVIEKIEGIKKAEGGKTIAETFAERAKLAGKEVAVRGKVVKYNANIMNKNWVHIQDGSGATGSNDLAVTTNDSTAVGKTVMVRGTVAIDKDFGAGYKYDVILEDAKVTAE